MAIFLEDGLEGGINSMKAKINSLTVRADLRFYFGYRAKGVKAKE